MPGKEGRQAYPWRVVLTLGIVAVLGVPGCIGPLGHSLLVRAVRAPAGAPSTLVGDPPCGHAGPGAGCVAFPQAGLPGFSWQNLTSSSQLPPSSRQGAASAYDPLLGGIVLFGGVGTNGKFLSDTWLFAGTWSQMSGPSPEPRAGAALAFDPSLNELVLFGGKNSVGPFGDTWVLRAGGNWTNVTENLSVSPSPRVYPMMAFDATDQQLVLFGGRTPNSVDGDTWVFSGTTWGLLSGGGPPSRYGAGFAYDPEKSALLLFGGFNVQSLQTVALGDTWTFAAGAWHQLATAASPTARGEAGMAFDLAQSAVILFGGANAAGAAFGDTWAFSGGGWSNLSSGLSFAPSARSSLAFAGANGTSGIGDNLLVFGGLEARTAGTPGATLDDTWIGGSLPLTALPVIANPRHFDLGQTVVLSVSVFGGQAPYAYNWTLPFGCDPLGPVNVPVISCVPAPTSTPTVQSVLVVVTGANNTGSVSSMGNFTVNSLPNIRSFTVKPNPATLGAGNVTFNVIAVGGTRASNYSYTYQGLPSGCASHNLQVLRCPPARTGTFVIEVQVTDGANVSVYQNVTLDVIRAPSGATLFLQKLSSPLGIAAILAALIVLALIGLILYRRRKKNPPKSPRPWGGSSTSGRSSGSEAWSRGGPVDEGTAATPEDEK